MIDIALITDENYLNQVIITITSLSLNSNKNKNYNVYVLCNNVAVEKQNLLKNYSNRNIKIHTIDAQDYIKHFPEFKNGNFHVTKSALIKFYLPEIFKDLDKILYLDSDILILKDLYEINSIDLSDCYIAAVKNSYAYPGTEEYLFKHNIKTNEYFNSGVMLLNLKKMREDNVSEKLIDYRINNRTFCMDQDALNAILGKNLKLLSYRYNLQITPFENNRFDEFCKIHNDYRAKNKKEALTQAYIIHFADKNKPWIYNRAKYSKLYKQYWQKAKLRQKFPKLHEITRQSVLRKIMLTIKLLFGDF